MRDTMWVSRDMKDICKNGINDIFGQAVVPMESEQPSVAAHPSMVQFNDAGEAIDLGKRAVMQAGFSEGRCVQLSVKAIAERSASGREQWVLSKINIDGSVLIANVGVDGQVKHGEVASVELHEFLCNYRTALHQIEIDNRTPVSDVPELMGDMFAPTLVVAMYKKRDAFPEVGIVRVQSKPSRSVFALRNWTAGDMIAMPVTNARDLKLQDGADTDVTSPFIATMEDGSGTKKSFVIGQMYSKESVSLPFVFKVTDQEDKANLQIGTLRVSAPVWTLQFEVTMPVVQASRDIKVEHDMVLFVQRAKKDVKRKAKDVSVDAPGAKKEKHCQKAEKNYKKEKRILLRSTTVKKMEEKQKQCA